MTKELLQQALDALTRLSFLGNGNFPGNSEGNRIAQKAVADIKQALAQQAHFEEQPDGTVIPVDPSEKAQQEQPASVDAYTGAREDAAIWKKRALAAEELNRKFIAEVNGPTYLGEPAQPAQEQYPLPDSLYPGSKDWMAGSYKERVEWLHGMYESAKKEVARLEAQQEPVSWEGADGWEPLAWHLCAEENGEESCAELIWEEGSVPEPWGDRWLTYEDAAKLMIATVQKYAPPTQPALSEREVELIDGMIEVQLNHANRCDSIANRVMADKQKGWDMERVALLQKLKTHCRGGVK